jgi:hypothetical protein
MTIANTTKISVYPSTPVLTISQQNTQYHNKTRTTAQTTTHTGPNGPRWAHSRMLFCILSGINEPDTFQMHFFGKGGDILVRELPLQEKLVEGR